MTATQRSGGSTPARLRLGMAVTAVLAVGFGVLGAYGITRRDDALEQAGATAEQLLAVQEIQVSVLHADSLASENHLREGAEDPQVRADYVDELRAATESLVAAANRVPADVAVDLGQASTLLTRYSGLVEQSRANNRQGYPVGAAYLNQANVLLTGDVVPALASVQSSLRDDVNDQLDSADAAGWWLFVGGIVMLAALAVAGVWMDRRFRRVLNVPLVVAAVVVLVTVVVAGSIQAAAMSRAEDAASGPVRAADELAQARSAAFAARTQEAITLIKRGNGAEAEEHWAQADADARAALDALCGDSVACAERQPYERYAQEYASVRSLDNDQGQWEAAVEASLTTSATAFADFSTLSAEAADAARSRAVADESAVTDSLNTARLGVFVAGLAVAALCIAGFGQRLREYR